MGAPSPTWRFILQAVFSIGALATSMVFASTRVAPPEDQSARIRDTVTLNFNVDTLLSVTGNATSSAGASDDSGAVAILTLNASVDTVTNASGNATRNDGATDDTASVGILTLNAGVDTATNASGNATRNDGARDDSASVGFLALNSNVDTATSVSGNAPTSFGAVDATVYVARTKLNGAADTLVTVPEMIEGILAPALSTWGLVILIVGLLLGGTGLLLGRREPLPR